MSLCLAMAAGASNAVSGDLRKTASQDECAGVLHWDGQGMRFGGAEGEDEGICVVADQDVAKVAALCMPEHFCRVWGTVEYCPDSGECVELSDAVLVSLE